MGKRSYRCIVISSSDEEGGVNDNGTAAVAAHSSDLVDSKLKKRRDAKGCSVPSTDLLTASLGINEDWPTFIPDTFSEATPFDPKGQENLTSPAWPKRRNEAQKDSSNTEVGLWVDKYEPRTLTGLAVNKKKVAEVKAWLERKFTDYQYQIGNNVLLLTGPTGAGKTATVKVVARILGIEVFEWDTPVPTLWREYLHQVSAGISYRSKLGEFENFLETIQNYPLLRVCSSNALSGSWKGTLLVIDDMPVINNWETCQRLCQHIKNLALHARYPIVFILTHYAEVGDNDCQSKFTQELELALEEGKATKVTFNSPTAKYITTALSKIWTAEYCCSPPEWLHSVSESSGCDIRNAINSLQFCCLSQVAYGTEKENLERSCLPKANCKRNSVKRPSKSCSSSCSPSEHTLYAQLNNGRDGTLSIFHCLGKFLHNKRNPHNFKDPGQTFALKENLARSPLQMGVPEVILSQAHAEAASFSAFAHENILDFIDEEAIDDAWMAVNYLSDSDLLLGCHSSRRVRKHQKLVDPDGNTTDIVESFAGSIAARGVLFANGHPAPPRWKSIRGPKLWQVERSSVERKMELLSVQWAFCGLGKIYSLSVLATEYKPLEYLFSQSTQCLHPASSAGSFERTNMDLEEIATEIDLIELDDYVPDSSVLPKGKNASCMYYNDSHNKEAEEMVEDEIEEW